MSYRQTIPGNGESVFRNACIESEWREWVTQCNSCGVVPEADDDKNMGEISKSFI